ncbi:MAG TPA: ATP-binding protein, partial [Desulfomonilia bacterium]|nr:ATP-binding protein [Desulfomonilia bacterium]
EAKQNFHFERLVEYCVALANEGGGKIIFGVTDKRPRSIVGTAAFAEPGRTEAGLYDRLSHRIPVEEIMTQEGRVLVVHVPSRLPGTAWQINGRYLKRAGDDLAALTSHELRAIFEETGPDFSAEICSGAVLNDLSPDAIDLFRDRWARKTRDDRKAAWTDSETLSNAELVVDGRITYAGLILFGIRAALGRHLAQAEFVFEYRSSEASGPAADREEFREGFFLWQDKLWSKINLRNDIQSHQDGLFRVDLPTFDEVPVREAVLNALAHRDYRLGGSVFIRQYAHRLEVVSPGGFPVGITPDNILDQQNPRNRRLAEALAKCGLIERSGQGMNLIFESAIRQGKPLPSFSGTSQHEVRLTLEGTVKSPAFVRFMERLGDQALRSFSTYDFLALDYIHREQTLPDYLKARLPGLIDAGAVESVGRGKGTRYLLCQRLYSALGAKGVYTRKRGLDRETNKALLEKHLRTQGNEGSPLSELRQVLPSESESSVQRLLNELREEGRVNLQGKRRWARWVPVGSKAQNNGHSFNPQRDETDN